MYYVVHVPYVCTWYMYIYVCMYHMYTTVMLTYNSCNAYMYHKERYRSLVQLLTVRIEVTKNVLIIYLKVERTFS